LYKFIIFSSITNLFDYLPFSWGDAPARQQRNPFDKPGIPPELPKNQKIYHLPGYTTLIYYDVYCFLVNLTMSEF